MITWKRMFDPFDPDKKIKYAFDPFAEQDGPQAAGDLVAKLAARVAELEDLADVKAADAIVKHLRFSRANLESLLALAESEIEALRKERDFDVESVAFSMLDLANKEIQNLRAERDSVSDALDILSRAFSNFARVTHHQHAQVKAGVEEAIRILGNRPHGKMEPAAEIILELIHEKLTDALGPAPVDHDEAPPACPDCQSIADLIADKLDMHAAEFETLPDLVERAIDKLDADAWPH